MVAISTTKTHVSRVIEIAHNHYHMNEEQSGNPWLGWFCFKSAENETERPKIIMALKLPLKAELELPNGGRRFCPETFIEKKKTPNHRLCSGSFMILLHMTTDFFSK